jgi:hypothetical protein
MNCDRAGALLSAYLRDELLPSTRAEVQTHLDHCPSCRADLDLDRLVFELPRVEPSAALHDRIFSSPEFQEIARALRPQATSAAEASHSNGHSSSSPVDDQKSAAGAFSHLVVLRTDGQVSKNGNGHQRPARPAQGAPRRIDWQRMALRMAVAAAILVLLLGSTLMIKNMLQAHPSVTKNTPDFGLADPVKGPLPAGNRVVYLHDNRLWSAPDAGEQARSPLTGTGVQVAPGWTVAPSVGPDHTHHVAYLDLKTGTLHFIQTDDSNDLLVGRVAPTGANLPAFWQSDEGQAILAGLAWAPDARQMAFVADPDGKGAALWLVNADGSAARAVSGPASAGALPRLPSWASDGLNLAYVVSQNGAASIWNYAFDEGKAQLLVSQASPQGNAGDVVRGLFWTADTFSPTVTWSAGAPDSTLVSGLWSYRLNQTPHLLRLAPADATFSAVDYSPLAGGVGSWLVGQVGVGLRSIHADGSPSVDLASGHMIAVHWAPDASGALYITGDDGATTGTLWTWTALLGQRKVAANVSLTPLPVWSPDARQVLYASNGQVFDVVAGGKITRVAGVGAAKALSWSPTGLRVALADAQGVEVINPDGSAPHQVDNAASVSGLTWTMAP